MNKEEQLEIISKEILVLKRKKFKPFFFDKEVFFSGYAKAGFSLLTGICCLFFITSTSLYSLYQHHREEIIKWIIIGLMVIFTLFILYVVIYKIYLKKRESKIDQKILELKAQYRIIKNSD